MPETSRADSLLPTGTVSFLFTDIEGSTTLWEQYPDAMPVALARHDTLLRQAIESSAGRIIKTTGDGVYAVFGAAPDALAACLAAQRALQAVQIDVAGLVPAASAARPAIALRVRMGLHTGVAELRDGDYFGGSLNRAARIMAVAHGGQILLSAATAEWVRGRLPEGVTLREMGELRLKGLLNPERLLQVVASDLRADFPPLASLNAHSLPAERDAFVGRREPLAELARRLDAGARLVSVLGTGGTGKTRLVTRFGWRSLGDFPGGVWFCDLAQARSLDGVVHAVAQGLDLLLGKDDPVTQIGHAIAGRNRCLVILDNFEQVLEHAPATLGRWLDRAADAAFVVTSRERLHLPGEEVFPIEPLLLATEAIELFAARAKAQRPDFVVSDTNHAAVAEVVRLLDGLPLAIELAAARVRVLSPAQIVERMEDRFRLLVGARGAAARQATLKAAIDWSWDLLTPWEQAALAQCSVFDGGFTLEAAEAVLDLARWPEAPPAMDAVQALVDKSLLRAWVPVEQSRYDIDEPYFGMYLSIHEYAAEKLDAGGGDATQQAQQRHGIYFATFGTDEAVESLSRHGGVKRRHALALELDNLVAACRRAIGADVGNVAAASCRAAWEVMSRQGPFSIGVALGAQVLALDGIEPTLRVQSGVSRADGLMRVGAFQDAREALEELLGLTRDMADRKLEGIVLGNLGQLHREQGRMNDAQRCLEDALTIFVELEFRLGQWTVLHNLGNLHDQLGSPVQSRASHERALAICRELGNRAGTGQVLAGLAILNRHQGRMEEAQAHYRSALAIHRELGDRRAEGIALGNLGNVLMDLGHVAQAQTHYEAALAIHREVGSRVVEGVTLANLGNLHRHFGRLDEAHSHHELALSISREMANRWHEGVVLTGLGAVEVLQGRMALARAHLDQALLVNRATGNRSYEGVAFGCLGELLVRQGQLLEATDALRQGEVLLRDIDNPLELANLLCIRGRAGVAAGEFDLARTVLTEAQTIANGMGATADSGLGRELAALRESIQ